MNGFHLTLCRLLLFAGSLTGHVAAQQWKAPTTMKKLANGLVVVVSEDHSAPTFGLCVSYGIGFRLEPVGNNAARLYHSIDIDLTSLPPYSNRRKRLGHFLRRSTGRVLLGCDRGPAAF